MFTACLTLIFTSEQKFHVCSLYSTDKYSLTHTEDTAAQSYAQVGVIMLLFWYKCLKMVQREPEQFQSTNTHPTEGQFIISGIQKFTCSQEADPL